MQTVSIENVVVRFVGDSGDGMQLVGTQFTLASAVAGNDLATLPDFPAEIRAPAGTTYGVSGFQLQIAQSQAFTPGDQPHVLVTMNPAGLKANLNDLPHGAVIIANRDAFTGRNLKLAGYDSHPLEDGSLDGYQVFPVPMTQLTVDAVASAGLKPKEAKRCTNFFALGLICWLYSRPLEPTLGFIDRKFAKSPQLVEANRAALKAGHAYGDTMEAFAAPFAIEPADVPAGEYRTINGNQALAMGLVTAAHKAERDLVFAGYPITPASSLLEDMAGYKSLGVRMIQAEDEIAAAGMALGASFAGSIGVTASSGPGICLKGEFLGLAVMTELPLVVIDVQRGGPSTGLPTKTEQSDLLLALFGRHGECPMPVLAASGPVDAFDTAIEAVRIAIRHMTPVLLLSDGSIANGAEPWRLPDPDSIEPIPVENPHDPEGFQPYDRDLDTLARPWALPGQAGFQHRIGGLEKAHGSGHVSYDPENHERMVHMRADKVQAVAQGYTPLEVDGPESGRLLVLGWGSTMGTIAGAVDQARKNGMQVAHLHLRHLWPLHPDLAAVLGRYEQVLIPEINTGQLRLLIQSQLGISCLGYNRVRGLPLRVNHLVVAFEDVLEGRYHD